MLDWKILEAEQSLPAAPSPPGRRRKGWWHPLLLLLLLVSLLLTGLWAQVRRQENRLREELGAIVEAEARLLAIRASPEQIATLVDPELPLSWRMHYDRYLSPPQPFDRLPALQHVSLEDGGMRASVTVQWSDPTGQGERAIIEQRAYRLFQGEWRRTARVVERGQQEEISTDHFLIRGSAEELSLVAQRESPFFVDLDGLREAVVVSWPAAWINPHELQIVIHPNEFPFEDFRFADARTVVANSPSFVLGYLAPRRSALSPGAEYRLRLAYTVTALLTRTAWQHDGQRWESHYSYFILLEELRQAEARRWALDARERRALRNEWRSQLAGEWEMPFQRSWNYSDVAQVSRRSEIARNHHLALALAIEYLILTQGEDVPGRIATRLSATNPTRFSPPELFSWLSEEMVGSSSGQLEQALREYTLTPELQPIPTSSSKNRLFGP